MILIITLTQVYVRLLLYRCLLFESILARIICVEMVCAGVCAVSGDQFFTFYRCSTNVSLFY